MPLDRASTPFEASHCISDALQLPCRCALWVHGGPYELAGDTYTESIAYGFGEGFNLLAGQKVPFRCRMDGEKWLISGKAPDGTTVDEAWVRAPKP